MRKAWVYFFLSIIMYLLVGCNNIKEPPETTRQISVTPTQAVPTYTPTPIVDETDTGVINQEGVMLGNNPTNFIYDGLIAKDNNWIYFPTDYLDIQSGFGRMKNNGEEFSYITSTKTRYRYLNISNEYLFYIEMQESIFGDIIRSSKDGSNKVVLLEGYFYGLTLINDYLYFLNREDKRIYKMKSDGTDLSLFTTDRCSLFLYDQGYIYVSALREGNDNNNKTVAIVKYNIDNPNDKYVIAENLPLSPEFGYLIHFFAHEGRIYYLDENEHCIYSMNDDGSELKKLNDIKVDSMLLGEDNNIYCISSDAKPYTVEIIRFDTTGDNIVKIYEFDYYNTYYLLGTAGEYLYYLENLGEGAVSGTTRIKIDGTEKEDLSEKYYDMEIMPGDS
jgi:hypothetical protein